MYVTRFLTSPIPYIHTHTHIHIYTYAVLPILNPIHLFPVQSKTNKSDNSICYFIGFNVDRAIFKADRPLNIELCASRFKEFLVSKYEVRNGTLGTGLDFFVDHHTWKRLPKEVFESTGGLELAKKIREENGWGKYGAKQAREDEASAAAAAAEAAAAAALDTDGALALEGGDKDVATAEELAAKLLADKKAAEEAQEEAARANRKRRLFDGAVGVVSDPNVSARMDDRTTVVRVTLALPPWKEAAAGRIAKDMHAHPTEVLWRLFH